jgi:hypothetical protein
VAMAENLAWQLHEHVTMRQRTDAGRLLKGRGKLSVRQVEGTAKRLRRLVHSQLVWFLVKWSWANTAVMLCSIGSYQGVDWCLWRIWTRAFENGGMTNWVQRECTRDEGGVH